MGAAGKWLYAVIKENKRRMWARALFKQGDYLFQAPNMIRNSSFHRGRHAQRLMHAAEVVIHEVQCQRVFVSLKLLAESVGPWLGRSTLYRKEPR
jgi:hypothetical protein